MDSSISCTQVIEYLSLVEYFCQFKTYELPVFCIENHFNIKIGNIDTMRKEINEWL